MLQPGDRVIVAVSGGPDSVCLLDVLYGLKDDLELELVIAHFNHGLRPGEDEAETQFVSSLAVSLGLAFESKRAETLSPGGSSLEEKARRARYGFLEETREKHRAHRIAIGHNLNDQAETFLMRLLRGSGPLGLSGIPPLRDKSVIRPLINVSREEIISHLRERGLSYVTDPTNADGRYLRNSIRLEVLPFLRRFQPRIVRLLGQTAEMMREDEACLMSQAEAWVREKAQMPGEGTVRFLRAPFLELPDALKKRVVRYTLNMTAGSLRRISRRHVQSIVELSQGRRPQARLYLPKGVRVERVYDTLVFTAGEDKRAKKDFSYYLQGPGSFELPALGLRVSLEEVKNTGVESTSGAGSTAFIDRDKVVFPLVVRSYRPGDRFVPYGMTGQKKLKDFFIDLKIPSETRYTVPILTHNDQPIWVGGLRIDERFKVTPETRRVLKVTLLV